MDKLKSIALACAGHFLAHAKHLKHFVSFMAKFFFSMALIRHAITHTLHFEHLEKSTVGFLDKIFALLLGIK